MLHHGRSHRVRYQEGDYRMIKAERERDAA